jgi:hypothetical protein
MKYLITLFTIFYSSLLLGQHNLIGNIKSISEKVHYFDKRKPKPKEPCLDCDNDSYYQYGVRLEPEFSEHLELFNIDWETSPYSNYKNYIAKFNKESQKTEETLLENDNRIREKKEYRYDDLNQKTSEIIYNRYLGHSIKNYNYNEQGQLKSEYETEENYSKLKVYFYDKNKKIRTEIYGSKGFQYQIFHKEIDSVGYIIHENYKVKNKIEFYEFNKNNIIQRKLFDKNGDLLNIKNYQLDSLKLIVNYCRYYNNNLLVKEVRKLKNRTKDGDKYYYDDIKNYTYNENKKLIIKEGIFDGKPLEYVTYSYTNNLLSEVITNAHFDTTFKLNFEYEFDKKGNCIKEIKHVNGVKAYIIKRKIKYYN